MVLSALSVLGMGLLGAGLAVEVAVIVAVALATLVVVAVVNAVTVLGRLLDALED
jgi:hypothetical protein